MNTIFLNYKAFTRAHKRFRTFVSLGLVVPENYIKQRRDAFVFFALILLALVESKKMKTKTKFSL